MRSLNIFLTLECNTIRKDKGVPRPLHLHALRVALSAILLVPLHKLPAQLRGAATTAHAYGFESELITSLCVWDASPSVFSASLIFL
jgi:hypothetical protein